MVLPIPNCPLPLNPHDHNVLSLRIPTVWEPIAIAFHEYPTVSGVPILPVRLFPQPISSLLDVIPNVLFVPALTCTQLFVPICVGLDLLNICVVVPAIACTGLLRLIVSPVPSSPEVLVPDPYQVPSLFLKNAPYPLVTASV